MNKQQIKIIFFLATFCCAGLLAKAQLQGTNNTYAIVVGISGYEDAAIPRLSFADKDATFFSQWLQTKAGDSVPQYNIKLLTNESAKVSAFYSALGWVKDKAKENDLVYIYFSGHGDVETRNKISQGFLLAWNSPPNNYLNNAISVSDLNNSANELTTKNKAKIILITDACHSGKMAGDFYKGRELTAANLRLVLNNQVRMASCREDEEAAEGQAWGGGRGVFSYYLIRGLQGEAEKKDIVNLQNLQQFLDSCFAADVELKQTKHIQHPISDGIPISILAKIDPSIATQMDSAKETITSAPPSPGGLISLRSVGPQPMDYFFDLAAHGDFENSLAFKNYLKDSSIQIPQKIVEDYYEYLRNPIDILDQVYYKDSLSNDSAFKKRMAEDMTQNLTPNTITAIHEQDARERQQKYNENLQTHDTLNHLVLLLDQLKKNSYSRRRFAERFVQLIQDQSQEMINAYLKGDMVELEKRQYYTTGKRDYRAFLPLMKIAIKLAPENNYLKNILQINEAYFDGLIDRLAVATNASAADSLLTTASKKIQNAMGLDPYSAYIHNEMGNILSEQKRYDSALWHYNYASLISPSWAIPYSNKITLYLATNHLPLALSAARTADSLQPNLAFVNINAGLVMEKTGDLLAAESYYLRAIKENNVHYLPYERLGYLYISTGDYAKADSFLYDATIRKELFTINGEAFRYGVRMSVGPGTPEAPYIFSCTNTYDTLFAGREGYSQMIGAIAKLQSPADSDRASGKKMITKILKKYPDIIFANHYLGKQLFNEGDYKQAELYLKKAVTHYRDMISLKVFLKKTFTDHLQWELKLKTREKEIAGAKKIKLMLSVLDSSCLLHTLLAMNYNGLEDHYILANIYHKSNRATDEIKEYKIIIAIENKNQNAQAALVGAYVPIKGEHGNRKRFFSYLYDQELDENQYHDKSNNTIDVGGSVKMARLLESTANYEGAEQALIAQVNKNQSAGFLRQKTMKARRLNINQYNALNKYWSDINENMERETFHFYERMLTKFPRDAYWYKSAGLFLYKRLLISFSQLHPAIRKDFYDDSKSHPFAFELNVYKYDPHVEFPGKKYIVKDKILLPGTGEEVAFDHSEYDPVSNANYFLQQALKFSGDKLPDPLITEYVADLQSWMGLNDSAIVNYRYALKVDPENVRLINKLSDVLRIEDRNPEVAKNLEILNKRNKLTTEQKFELTDYYMLQKKYDQSMSLLKSIPGNIAKQNTQKYLLQIKFNMLKNEFAKALTYVNTLLLQPGNDYNLNFTLLYNKARIEAFTNDNKSAIKTLNQLFDDHCNWYYLLKLDNALINVRKEPGWVKFMQAHPLENIYDLPQ
ncbi:MAG: caspase family protein [Ginsengibacter sp.]